MMKKWMVLLACVLCLAVAGCGAQPLEELPEDAAETVTDATEPETETKTPDSEETPEPSSEEPETSEKPEAPAETGEEPEQAPQTEEPDVVRTLQKEATTVEIPAGGTLEGLYYCDISVQDYGVITLELDAAAAPETVTNFVRLVQQGFYDGLTFHRVIDGFMIQGGDPSGDGTGGSQTTIPGEFSANGVENPISHTRGTVSMARTVDYDSASSQFFICQADCTYLDGEYAAFGRVLEGMELVDRICTETPVADSNGSVLPEQQPVITSVTMVTFFYQ